MTNPDLDGLLERFATWGARPTVDGYLDLFDEGATLFDSGMSKPLVKAEIRPAITRTLGILDGFHLQPIRVGRNRETLFVEAGNTACVNGCDLEWDAIYCMTARGSRVVRGRRYYDQAAIFKALLDLPTETPRREAGPIVLEPGEVGHASGDIWFREWCGSAAPTGVPQRFDLMERFAEGELRYFYNTLALKPESLSAVTELQAALAGHPPTTRCHQPAS